MGVLSFFHHLPSAAKNKMGPQMERMSHVSSWDFQEKNEIPCPEPAPSLPLYYCLFFDPISFFHFWQTLVTGVDSTVVGLPIFILY